MNLERGSEMEARRYAMQTDESRSLDFAVAASYRTPKMRVLA